MLKIIKNFKSKLTVIDLFGISLFFAILGIAAIFFLRKSAFTYVTIQISKNEDSFYNFWFYKPTDWYIENLEVGMATSDLLARDNLKLVDVYYYPSLDTLEQTVFVTLKVKSTYNKYSQQYSYQGQPLLIGEHRIFKLGSVSIPGIIYRVNDTPIKVKTKKILVEGVLENEDNEKIKQFAETRFFGVKNYLVEKLEPGLEIKNSKDESVAKIIDVTKSFGYREFIYQNSLVKVSDPERTNVRLLVELTLSEVNGHYLHREEDLVLLGEKLLLSFDDFVIKLRIEDIKDI